MDYEKKYKKALERARKWYNDSHITIGLKGNLKDIFPELAEPDDERIRKMLIEFFGKGAENNGSTNGISDKDILAWLEKQGEIDKESYKIDEKEKREFVGDGFIKCYADFQDFKEGETYWLEYIGDDKYNVRSDNLLGKTYHITPCQLYTVFKKLTWLEKQGEQKSDNKVEPKFHEGDWIISNDNKSIYQVIEVKRGIYIIRDIEDNYEYHIGIEECERTGRLWTIKDAKDGDVLVIVNDERPFIYKGCLDPKHPDSPVAYCGIDDGGYFCGGSNKFNHWWTDKKVQPATKEQRNNLIKVMTDAGYIFDFEKKELKKTEPIPAWSEEDERLYRGLQELIYSTPYCDSRKKISDWLKSLKDRMGE